MSAPHLASDPVGQDFGIPVSIPVQQPGRAGAGAVGGRQWGAGPVALVFLHANGFCGSTYAPILAPLAAQMPGRSVVALDLRGHGRTTLEADPLKQDRWTIHRDDMAAALAGLPGGADPRGLVLAGHSMGGTTSILLAGSGAGVLLRRLVLFDPVFAPRPFYLYAKAPWVFGLWRSHFPMAANARRRRRTFPDRAAALAAYTGRGAFKSWQPAFLEGYLQDGLTAQEDGSFRLSCDPEFEASCFAGQRHDPHGALRRARVPVTVFKAQRGSTCRDGTLARIAPPGSRVEEMAGTSHFLPMERPDLCGAALLEALSGP
jgi:pimeloyl-ACP methyl ester carboxylesterase